MRDLHITGLPSENDIVQTKEILSVIGGALTTFRSHMKTRVCMPSFLSLICQADALKIKASLEANSKIRNIADLAHDLVSTTRVSLTLQLYIRLAFLVSVTHHLFLPP